MLTDFLHFFSFSDPNVRYVAIGSVLLAASSAVVGCFTFLRKRALVGDAVAHAVLPGVCLAFLLAGTKNPLVLLLGAFITGWFSLVALDFITSRTRIKEDAAIGIVLSVFFGIGSLLLTAIQHGSNASQAGLDRFLFGKAASLVGDDLLIFGTVGALLVVFTVLFFKEFALISFDEDFAKSIGFPVRRIELILTTLTVLAVVVGIQAVGVVLMAAMLITPAAAARYWTENLRLMVLFAAIFGGISGISGACISYIQPSMPTGPWIVVVISMVALISILFAPQRGIVARFALQNRNRRKIQDENILKLFFHLGEEKDDYNIVRGLSELINRRSLDRAQLKNGLRRLSNQGYLIRTEKGWQLTDQGRKRGARVTRIHRLWELYLTQYLRIASDHVHEDAETIEHIITPELEAKLAELLKFPETDPHERKIPHSE